MARKKPRPGRVLPPRPGSHRLLRIAAALMLLPAAAWGDDISSVTFSAPTARTADDGMDVITLGGGDPLGGASGIIVYDGAAQIGGGGGASNGNAAGVDGAVMVGVNYYTVAGGATVNQAGDSLGNAVNVTAAGGATTIGNNKKGGVVGGVVFFNVSPGVTPVGKAANNAVTLTGGNTGSGTITVEKDVVGGLSTHGGAEENTVVIDGGTGGVIINGDVYGGFANSRDNAAAAAVTANAYGNTVTLSGKMTIVNNTYNHIFGGKTGNGDATGNKVRITATDAATALGLVKGGVAGNEDASGNVTGNTVEIDGTVPKGTVFLGIVGGETWEGEAKGNAVIVGGGTVSYYSVIGGDVGLAGNATGNTVAVNAQALGNNPSFILGARVAAGKAEGNKVNITDTRPATTVFSGYIVGGAVTVEGEASGNEARLTGVSGGNITAVGGALFYGGGENTLAGSSTVSGNKLILDDSVIGGLTGGGALTSSNDQLGATGSVAISGNIVLLTGASYAQTIHGGWTADQIKGDVTGNRVSIDTTYKPAGGEKITVTGGNASAGNAIGNEVYLAHQGVFGDVSGGLAGVGTGTAFVNGNVVTIMGTAPEGDVFALVAESVTGGATEAATSSANGNLVTITNAKAGRVTGGQAGSGGDAIDNHVTIRDAVITGNVLAGVVWTSGSAGNATGNATGNSVTLDNVTIDATDDAITIAAAQAQASAFTGSFTGNTVTLTGEITLLGSGGGGNRIDIKGADFTGVNPAAPKDAYTGNALVVRDFMARSTDGGVFGKIGGFERYDFYLGSAPPGGDPVLSAGEIVLDDEMGGGAGHAKVSLALAGKAATLKPGDRVWLFKDDDDVIAGTAQAALAVTQGATLQYDARLNTDGTVDIIGVGVSEDSKALAEGAVAGLALLTQGGDLAAGKGIAAAARRARDGDLTGIAVAGGGRLRYDTGSYADVDGYSLLAGLAYGADLAAGKLVFGVFVEYGSADFDTRNSLPGRKIKGGGDTAYLGSGLLLRFDQAGGPGGHVHGEASLRAGKAETDFSSRDLNTGFDTTSGYFGLHLGTGYLWRMSDSANLDLYVKYLWSHQEGDKVTLSSGDPVAFGDVDSHRARLGARLAWQATPVVNPYAGLAYEYEFDGKAKASAYGQPIDAPELKGGTGIGEAGLSFQAGKNAVLDAGVQVYTGKRDGVTGSLRLNVAF